MKETTRKLLDQIRQDVKQAATISGEEQLRLLKQIAEHVGTLTKRLETETGKPHAVVSWYSFDRPQVDLFGSDEEAVAYLKTTAEKELAIDVDENGWAAKLESDTDGGYAKLITDFGDHEDITEFSIPSLIIDHREDQNTEETDPVKERCRDCCYLVEGRGGAWICDDWNLEIHKVPDEDCAVENPDADWCYQIVDDETGKILVQGFYYGIEKDARVLAKQEMSLRAIKNAHIETFLA